jgi:FG-GAP repeat protein
MKRNSLSLRVQVVFPGLLLSLALAACGGGSSTDAGCGSHCVPTGGEAGSFAGPLNYAMGMQPVAVAAGDVNGDGKPDLAAATEAAATLASFWETVTELSRKQRTMPSVSFRAS